MKGGGDTTIVATVPTMESHMPQLHRPSRSGMPITRTTYRAASGRSRGLRWRDAVAELVVLQQEYAAWLAALPDSLQESALAEALQAICDLDLDELQTIELPRGFGRD
jgi:hypothetical protein